MTLSSILGAATSGLSAAQAQIRATSTNVSNINTPGYARVQTNLVTRTTGGVGSGVDVATVTRATNLFLQRASLSAQSDQAAASALNQLWEQLSPYLGTADQNGALVSRLSDVQSAFSSASADPSSSLRRTQVVTAVRNLLSEVSNLSNAVTGIRAQADTQIGAQISQANDLLKQIAALNTEISRTRAQGGDSTGAENQQAALIDQLSGYVSVRTDLREGGGVIVRTPDGITLADAQAATINYTPIGQGDPGANYKAITITPPAGGVTQDFASHIDSGSIAGLLHARDGDMIDLLRSLGELSGGITNALNASHNASTSYPAPAALSGRQTGLLGSDSMGFSGKTTIAIVNTDGTLGHTIEVDFGAGSISVNGGAASSIGTDIASFAAALNTAMTGAGIGSASFTNGKLSINATNGGIAIQDDPASPAARGGRGFSQFFGLNDLIQTTQPYFYDTGLSGTDAHGFTGGTLQFQIRSPAGHVLETKSITIGGTTIDDILASLNSTTTGLGLYASFTLDGNGAIVQTTAPGADGYAVNLTGDTSTRGGTGLSFSQIFGLGDAARAGRASDASVNPAIVSNSGKLAFAQPELTGATLGAVVLTAGDARGVTALTKSFDSTFNFSAAGGLSAMSTTVNAFASQFLGLAGSRAARADSAEASAKDLATEVAQRRGSVEGVNLDEELAQLTLYQQAYNASARLVSAAQDMMDALMSIR